MSVKHDVISKGVNVKNAIIPTDSGDIIPAVEVLSNVNLEITQTGKEYRLKEALSSVQNNYDFIIIDTAPALGLLTINAFVASDYLLIPTLADIYSLSSIGQLYTTYQAVVRYCNNNLKIAGILLTRHNDRMILSRDIANMIQETSQEIGTKLFSQVIREGVAIREAQAVHQDIFAYAPKSNPAQDYKLFLNEFMATIKEEKK